jgi:hypothetical protein
MKPVRILRHVGGANWFIGILNPRILFSVDNRERLGELCLGRTMERDVESLRQPLPGLKTTTNLLQWSVLKRSDPSDRVVGTS